MGNGGRGHLSRTKTALEVAGLELKEKKNPNLSAQYFGFVAAKEDGKIIIKKVEPNSVPDKNGIAPEDEITKVNGGEIEGKLADILKESKENVTFTVKKKFSEKSIPLAVGNYYKLLELVKKENTTEEQLTLRKVWSS